MTQGPEEEAQRRTNLEGGFSLLDTLIGAAVLTIGTLGAATLAVSSSKLQVSVSEYATAHTIACDMIEQLRAGDLATLHAQFTATPEVTVQERRVTVSFPQEVLDQTFGGSMTTADALAAGFLPVRIVVSGNTTRYQFATFVGQK